MIKLIIFFCLFSAQENKNPQNKKAIKSSPDVDRYLLSFNSDICQNLKVKARI